MDNLRAAAQALVISVAVVLALLALLALWSIAPQVVGAGAAQH